MSTQISSKLAALAIALMMNSLIIGAAAYLFNGQIQQRSTTEPLAGTIRHAGGVEPEILSR